MRIAKYSTRFDGLEGKAIEQDSLFDSFRGMIVCHEQLAVDRPAPVDYPQGIFTQIYADRIRLHYFPFLRMTIKFDAITYWSMPAQPVELMGLSRRGIRILPQVGTRFANRSGQALSVHTSRPQRFQIVLASEQEAVEVGQLLGSLLPIPSGDLRNP